MTERDEGEEDARFYLFIHAALCYFLVPCPGRLPLHHRRTRLCWATPHLPEHRRAPDPATAGTTRHARTNPTPPRPREAVSHSLCCAALGQPTTRPHDPTQRTMDATCTPPATLRSYEFALKSRLSGLVGRRTLQLQPAPHLQRDLCRDTQAARDSAPESHLSGLVGRGSPSHGSPGPLSLLPIGPSVGLGLHSPTGIAGRFRHLEPSVLSAPDSTDMGGHCRDGPR